MSSIAGFCNYIHVMQCYVIRPKMSKLSEWMERESYSFFAMGVIIQNYEQLLFHKLFIRNKILPTSKALILKHSEYGPGSLIELLILEHLSIEIKVVFYVWCVVSSMKYNHFVPQFYWFSPSLLSHKAG